MKDYLMDEYTETPGEALTDAEAMEVAIAVKKLHMYAKKTGNRGLIKAAEVAHERAKRYGLANHKNITQLSGTS